MSARGLYLESSLRHGLLVGAVERVCADIAGGYISLDRARAELQKALERDTDARDLTEAEFSDKHLGEVA